MKQQQKTALLIAALIFGLRLSARADEGADQRIIDQVQNYGDDAGVSREQVQAAARQAEDENAQQALQPRVGQPDDIIVDPLSGQSYVRGSAPRPEPVKTWVDEKGVRHYPLDNEDTQRAALIENLCGRIAYDGARPQARASLERVMHAMFAQSPVEVLHRLANARLSIRIVPEGYTIPDMPGTGYLAGKKTPDGRTMDQVRGMATDEGEVYMRRSVMVIPSGDAPAREIVFDKPIPVPLGAWTVFIPEANLLESVNGPKGRDGLPRETVVHELGHAVHKIATADPFDERWGSDREIVIEREYNDAREQKLGYTDPYAKTNSGEYFAQATASWFGLNSTGKGAEWIQENQPELYATLLRLYGPARPLGVER